jgi:hypothetical protein
MWQAQRSNTALAFALLPDSWPAENRIGGGDAGASLYWTSVVGCIGRGHGGRTELVVAPE